MYPYAIYEVHGLLSRLPLPVDDRSPVLRYLCALFAELAYYYVPQWELGDRKRAKLIPCDAYQVIVARDVPTDVRTLLQQLDLPRGFAVADRGVVAVGIVLNRLLFIGFRGTQFLFDWRINLLSRLTPVNTPCCAMQPLVPGTISGRWHAGFGEEGMRISIRILDAFRDAGLGDIDHVFLSGHSLGGAVAAISANFIRIAPTSVCIFGAPRYADLSAYVSSASRPPVQVRRSGDVVPTIPPKMFGYVDHPYEFGTGGTPYIDPDPYTPSFGGLLRWGQFLLGRFKPHSIEVYRHELGANAGASAASSALAPVEKLTRAVAEIT